MSVSAKLNHLRIAPRKVRMVADLIRGKKASKALVFLNFSSKKAARPLRKLLEQAIANAKNNFQLDEKNLFVQKIQVDEGPKLKRWRARSRGQTFEIQKKTSHVSLVLEKIEGKEEKIKKKRKLKKEKIERKSDQVPEKEKLSEKDKPARKGKRPKPKLEIQKPKTQKGIRRFFRRKAF
jgi:large subunit ribosomal protein L22